MRYLHATTIICCVAIHCRGGVCAATDLDLISTRDSAAATARRITTLQLNTRIKYESGQETEVRTCRSGAKFIIERRDLKPGKLGQEQLPLMSVVAAYNGERYQHLNLDSATLKLTDGILPSPAPDICIRPYSWLLAGQDAPPTLESLRNQALWERRFSDAAIEGTAVVREHECLRIRFHIPVGRLNNNVYVVYFAQSLGMYPIKYERLSGPKSQLSSSCDVISVHTSVQDGMACVVPTRLLYKETGADGASTPRSLEIVADAESLAVNAPIDDDVFTISQERARTLFDVQKQAEAFRQHLQPAILDDEHHRSVWRGVAATALVLILVLLAMAVLRYRRHMLQDSKRSGGAPE